jgi:predicted cupin superfamily sugar epimerase
MEENNLQSAGYWIRKLNLQLHPEGGYYNELYRSKLEVSRWSSVSVSVYNACTSIYYLLEGHDYSSFHRLASDEIWYFHKGVPLLIHMIGSNGVYTTHELSDSPTGSLTFMVEAGIWFAAEIPSGTDFTLVSCVVAPGFEFKEFEMADKEILMDLYPQHAVILNKLCRVANPDI